jgi:hypothetical protein
MTTSAYTLLEVPVPRQKLVHVHAGGGTGPGLPGDTADQLELRRIHFRLAR